VDVDKPGGYSPTRIETRPVPHSFITGGAAMKRTAPLAVSALIVGTLIGSVGTQALHAQQQGLKRTPLMQKDLAGIEGNEALMVLAEIAPGAQSGRHYHPGTEIAYVLSGTGAMEVDGQAPRI